MSATSTRLIPIHARAVPDHKTVEVTVNFSPGEWAQRTFTPAEARRLGRQLLEAADAAEVPPEKRRRNQP